MKLKLIQMIEEELTKPRQLTEQVINYIASHYSYTLDQIDKFFEEELSKLEDYELDLLFSPIFTPKVSDKAIFSKILDDVEITSEDVDEIVENLKERNLTASFFISLKKENGTIEKKFSVPLNRINLERYIRLLYLDCQPSKQLSRAIDVVFRSECDKIKAILRDKFWKEEWREEFLRAYLVYIAGQGEVSVEKFELLLKIFRSNPTARDIYEIYESISDLIQWTQSQVDMLKAGGKRFFNEMIEQTYKFEGGDKRIQKEEELRREETELRYYIELKNEVGYIIEKMKELLPINNAKRMARI
jgi:hypothetical protein